LRNYFFEKIFGKNRRDKKIKENKNKKKNKKELKKSFERKENLFFEDLFFF
jgi:hypothetical protein